MPSKYDKVSLLDAHGVVHACPTLPGEQARLKCSRSLTDGSETRGTALRTTRVAKALHAPPRKPPGDVVADSVLIRIPGFT
jgi:hypothetical protein